MCYIQIKIFYVIDKMKKIIFALSYFLLVLSLNNVKADELSDLLKIEDTNTVENRLFKANCSQKDAFIKCSIQPENNIYLYKDSIKPESSEAIIANVSLPKGISHEDSQGIKQIYKTPFEIEITITNAKAFDTVVISAQGCDSSGICYAPATYKYAIEKDISAPSLINNEDNVLFSKSDNFALILLLALIFGAALDLTPCSLPLLSIYSATILGSHSTKKDAFINNAAYIVSLALGYSFIGIIFSFIGVSAHGFLQHPVTCIVLSLILLVLALHTLDLLRLPNLPTFNSKIQNGLAMLKNGSVKKAVVMGLLSALFTTPCTSAPLTGALIYVMTTNSIVLGSLIFFAIGLGMGLPLIIIGLFGSKALNIFKSRTSIIKKLLSLPLIITALFVSRHLLGEYSQIASICVYSICLFTMVTLLLNTKNKILKISLSSIALAACFAIGYYFENSVNVHKTSFEQIYSIEDLEKYKGEKIYLTVSASWCANCHQLDDELYSTNEFKTLLKDYRLLRYDFTDPNSDSSVKFSTHFNMLGVPYSTFIDENLNTLKSYQGLISIEDLKKR